MYCPFSVATCANRNKIFSMYCCGACDSEKARKSKTQFNFI